MQIDNIKQLIDEDFSAVNTLITHELHTDVDLINQLSQHIIYSGGKRIRPVLVLLSAHACGYNVAARDHIAVAAIIEFIHTATLLHDDVVDESTLRRGRKTANAIWGNEASVLVGDFLYSRAFQMMVRLKNSHVNVMRIFADTTNTIAEGEVLQLLNCHNDQINLAQYMRIIYCKTAKLFEAAAQLGAELANLPEAHCQAMATYGKHLGNAFQLIDDTLDYAADVKAAGKQTGSDLAQGKPTMPLIHVLEHGTAAEQALVRTALHDANTDQWEAVLAAINANGGLTITQQAACNEVDQALSALMVLKPSPYRDALEQLAQFSLQRNY
ncbi:MAG: octaprenyl diphosphate synthase [Gammaproteobacteria bacterium]